MKYTRDSRPQHEVQKQHSATDDDKGGIAKQPFYKGMRKYNELDSLLKNVNEVTQFKNL
jgi:hypothetical protein